MSVEAARTALRENVKRLARLRESGGRIEREKVHFERMLLFSLVHGLVCAMPSYSPMQDMQLKWVDWFLDFCQGEKVEDFEFEEAMLFLILEWEVERCGRDHSCGESW